MTFVATFSHPLDKVGGSQNTKYVKQTYEAMSRSDINLEFVAQQISLLPVREQNKFFRLLLNYIEFASTSSNPALKDVIELCVKMINVVNDHYEQLELEF